VLTNQPAIGFSSRFWVSVAKVKFAEANLRLVVSMARKVHRTRHVLPGFDPERDLGLMRAVEKFDYERRLQVLDRCDLVNPAGDHAGNRRPGAPDPRAGAHGRGDQQGLSRSAAAGADARPRAH